MRPHLLLPGLLLSLPVFAEDAGVPSSSAVVRIPAVGDWEGASEESERQERLPLRCGPSSGAEVLLSTSIDHGGSCARDTVSQSVTVRGAEGQVWLGFERSRTDGESTPPALELECREHTLRVRVGRAPALELKPKPEGGVSVGPSLEQELMRRLSAPARGQVEEARSLEFLVSLFLPTDASSSRLRTLALVHSVREHVAAGDWRSTRRLPDPGALEKWPDLAASIREVERTVEEGRQKSQPLRALAPRRIGKLLRFPSLAPNGPGLFWRGRELCAQQQDDSGQLRCFDTGKNRWGTLEPMPESLSERFLEYVPGGCGAICASGSCVAPRADLLLLGSTLGEALVMFSEGRWRAGARVLSPKEVSAEFARGPGGPVLGGGRYVSLGGDYFSSASGGDSRSWHLFPAPPSEPEGGHWLGMVVSPDQSQVAAISGTSSSQPPFFLWVARIAPVKVP
ncbi:hypothetical protein JQX13_24500 [Archangium violaceum]|uniref:hypothetical protein n=1 Tax=Archangium violaceum TaxID=83451 RepID=UPI00193B599F|nr:hypothetical protein [Archangium violaceum]QRK12912.1 hypothetical protein JQX13_24500 [Archangium violaceum]